MPRLSQTKQPRQSARQTTTRPPKPLPNLDPNHCDGALNMGMRNMAYPSTAPYREQYELGRQICELQLQKLATKWRH
jgi:hypothetical protein